MSTTHRSQPDASHQAFTLLELLATMAVILACAAVLLPAKARSSSNVQALQCLFNQKQLMAGMLMYTQENSDLFVPNPDDGNTVSGHNWCPLQGEQPIYEPEFLRRYCLLMPYLNDSVELLRCTAEGPYRVLTGPIPMRHPPFRSISVNHAVGTICVQFDATSSGHSGKPTLSVNAPWLSNVYSNRRNKPFRTYGRTSEVSAPGPAALWVLTEEDRLSINDGNFACPVSTAEWIDFPSTRHEFGCVFGFADGHTELHKWADPRTKVPYPILKRPVPGSVDWLWMSKRTSSKAP